MNYECEISNTYFELFRSQLAIAI